jgi:hypothetical protein
MDQDRRSGVSCHLMERIRETVRPQIIWMTSRNPAPFPAQQFNVARRAIDDGFTDANGLVAGTEFSPLRLQLILRGGFVRGASFQDGRRAAFGPAFAAGYQISDHCRRRW